MCGFAGFLRFGPLPDAAAAIARAMGDRLAHRGPDDRGEWLDPAAGLGLAHRRLAIVDLTAAGAQPMASACGRWVIAFNGEIYNHAALRTALEAAGRAPAWRGHSDTETLLAALAAWGAEDALARCVGMFAFALWDRHEQTLLLARDRLGEKPLYWGRAGDGTLLFASEPQALGAWPGWQPRIDRGAVALLLQHGYVPAPHSVFEGLHKLPPGHLLRIARPADTAEAPVAWWSLREVARRGAAAPLAIDEADAVDRLDALLRQAVDGQRMADVPLGAFLSGGIDSSLTVAVMQALSREPVRSFTIGLPDAALDESAEARAVARHLGTQHTELVVTADEALRTIPELPAVYAEPFADASQIPTLLVSRLARRQVTVALSGDGGDELFGGYDRYRWAQRIAAVPRALRRGGGALLGALPAAAWAALLAPVSPLLPRELREGDRADRLRKLHAVLAAPSDDALYRLLVSFWPPHGVPVPGAATPPRSAFDEPAPPGLGFEARMMLLDGCSYLPDDILAKVDRAAMAASLETRVPLLDHRIVEFAFALPLALKMRDGRGKWLLRRVLDRYVPRSLVDRPKKGFGIPIHAWLRGPLRDWAESLLDARRLADGGFVDPAPVRQLWAEHRAGRNDWGYRLWPVLMFEAWRESPAGRGASATPSTSA